MRIARIQCHGKLNAASTALYYPLPNAAVARGPMIDSFALGLSHGLMLLAAWRLLGRPDLDDDAARPRDADGTAGRWAALRSRLGA